MTGLADLVKAATPGPWEAHIGTYGEGNEEFTEGISLGEDFIETDGGYYGPKPANARLIALTPELAVVAIAAEYWKDMLGTNGSPNAQNELIMAIADLHQRLAE